MKVSDVASRILSHSLLVFLKQFHYSYVRLSIISKVLVKRLKLGLKGSSS